MLPVTPRLESCYFGTGAGDQWPRLARVLAHTALQQCPGWAVSVQAIALPRPAKVAASAYLENTHKLEHWCSLIAAAPDGASVLLIDADTAILRPLDDVWEIPFDVAYTTKTGKFPLNAGVVFVRVSEASRAFLLAWRDENRRMLGDPHYHRDWRRQFGGINQAALGSVLRSPYASTVQIARLPCPEWNCEDASWLAFSEATRILHIKSALRRAVFLLSPTPPALGSLVKLWKGLEREAGRVAA